MALSDTAKFGLVLAFIFLVGFMSYVASMSREAEITALQANDAASQAQLTADVALMMTAPPPP